MAIPVTFAVQPADGGLRVTVQFGIATEPGQRLDKAGRTIKPHFIEEVVVRHNERTILTAYLGPAMARNPELSFNLENARAGESIVLTGRTNRGEAFEASHRLA